MSSLARKSRVLRSVVEDCVVASRLGATWADRWRLASALVGWHHADRIPLLNGRRGSKEPVRLRAFGRTFDVALAAEPEKNEMLVFHEVFGQHVYEMSPAHEPRVIVDLGSFTGLSPLFFALRHPQAAIYCLEPDPDNYAALCRNTAAFPAIQHLNYAVAGTAGPREFFRSPMTCAHSLYQREPNARSISVSCMTVNDLIERFRLPAIDILKFDVEGAETEVFADFPFKVPVHALVGELHLSPADEQAFAQKFSSRGYSVSLERDQYLGLTTFRATAARGVAAIQ